MSFESGEQNTPGSPGSSGSSNSCLSFREFPDELLVNVIHFYVSDCFDFSTLLSVSKRFNRILTKWPFVWKNITRDVLLGAKYSKRVDNGQNESSSIPRYFQRTPFTRILHSQFSAIRDSRIKVEVEVCEDEDVPPAPSIQQMKCYLDPIKFHCPKGMQSLLWSSESDSGGFYLMHEMKQCAHLKKYLNSRPHFKHFYCYAINEPFYIELYELYCRETYPSDINERAAQVKEEVRWSLYLMNILKTTFALLSQIGILFSIVFFGFLIAYFLHGYVTAYIGHFIDQRSNEMDTVELEPSARVFSEWNSCANHMDDFVDFEAQQMKGNRTGEDWSASCEFFKDVMWPYMDVSSLFICYNLEDSSLLGWLRPWLTGFAFIDCFIVIVVVLGALLTLVIVVPTLALSTIWADYLAPTLHTSIVAVVFIYVFAFLVHFLLMRLRPTSRILWTRLKHLECRITQSLPWEATHSFCCFALALALIDPSPYLPIWLFAMLLCVFILGEDTSWVMNDQATGMVPKKRIRALGLLIAMQERLGKRKFWKIIEQVILIARVVHVGLMCKFVIEIRHNFNYAMARSAGLWRYFVNIFTINLKQCPGIAIDECIAALWNYAVAERIFRFFSAAISLLVAAILLVCFQHYYTGEGIYKRVLYCFLAFSIGFLALMSRMDMA